MRENLAFGDVKSAYITLIELGDFFVSLDWGRVDGGGRRESHETCDQDEKDKRISKVEFVDMFSHFLDIVMFLVLH